MQYLDMLRGQDLYDAHGFSAMQEVFIALKQRSPSCHGNNCWHLKRDGHISINNWQGKEPVMVYSDQLMLLREFQTRYDALWKRGAGAIGSRANVISILQDVAGRME